MDTIKNILGSKTVWGLVITAIPTVANIFGYSVTEGFSEGVAGLVDQTAQLVGIAIALYGRAVALKPLISKK